MKLESNLSFLSHKEARVQTDSKRRKRMKRNASYICKKTEDFRKTVLEMITLMLILLENSPQLSQSRHCDLGLEAREVSFSI